MAGARIPAHGRFGGARRRSTAGTDDHYRSMPAARRGEFGLTGTPCAAWSTPSRDPPCRFLRPVSSWWVEGAPESVDGALATCAGHAGARSATRSSAPGDRMRVTVAWDGATRGALANPATGRRHRVSAEPAWPGRRESELRNSFGGGTRLPRLPHDHVRVTALHQPPAGPGFHGRSIVRPGDGERHGERGDETSGRDHKISETWRSVSAPRGGRAARRRASGGRASAGDFLRVSEPQRGCRV
ncbi:hypothetical protein Save01_03082 [Streptomyces avermitilis]